jgi:CheY-like chemotaxis protein
MAALRLLVVEDDVASLELMEEVFSSLKADVRGVGESSKAAELVNRERFDGIFLDLEMPSMNGFDLSRWIRNSSWNRSTPIIIVTGRDDRQTMQRVFASGATFYLQKPVDRHKLTNLYRTVRGSLYECRRRFLRVPLHTDVTSQTWAACAPVFSLALFWNCDRCRRDCGLGCRETAGNSLRACQERGSHTGVHYRN